MKTFVRLLLVAALMCPMSFAIGCTGPTALEGETDEEGKVSGMEETDYASEMEKANQDGAAKDQSGGGGGYPGQ